MAKRTTLKRRDPTVFTRPTHTCSECAYAYGLHERSVSGEMFMLHCQKREPFSVIKTWAACKEFKLKEDEDRGKEAV